MTRENQPEINAELIAKALALPTDDAAWQSACEFEQRAAREFIRQRAMAGKFAGATIFGTLIEVAEHARATFGDENQSALDMMLAMFTEAFGGGDGKGHDDG